LTQPDDRREYPSLGEIVREKTNDGLSILDFYIGAFEGELEDFNAAHRLETAQDLLDLVVNAVLLQRRWHGTTLAIVLGSNLDLFRRVVGFQVDIVEGREEGFTVRQRVLLAEQLRNCRTLVDSVDAGGKFSKIFRQETGEGAKTDRFLRDVVERKTAGVNRADRRSARKLLDDKEPQVDQAPCRAFDCCADWKTSILAPAYVSQALDDAHADGCGCTDHDDGEFIEMAIAHLRDSKGLPL
jgi:hypothetical protein